ncbi:hypothetical protein LAJ55_14370, partial [Streptococcus pneumoniae]|uniref:hypothetical protein n=1 Tax=Streptococcus pneumoniae TaxID=1313 RepID=UPI001CBC3929
EARSVSDVHNYIIIKVLSIRASKSRPRLSVRWLVKHIIIIECTFMFGDTFKLRENPLELSVPLLRHPRGIASLHLMR